MGEWRYYAQRAATGRWLDTNVQLKDVDLDWVLSGPAGGEAFVPAGLASPYGADGRFVWGKWDTVLFAEEDGNLAWAGICTAANPDPEGMKLEFIGPTGWLQGIPYTGQYQVWERDVFDVVRHLVAHSAAVPNHIPFSVSTNRSQFTVGDPQPPSKPKRPARRKGETKSAWQNSARYEKWERAVKRWETKYKDHERFEIVWWEAPYIGEEIDTLAKEAGFDYRERVRWSDKGALKAVFHLDLDDAMIRRRTDIKLVDGMNLAQPLDAKDTDDAYANRVIALGAGEGRAMTRVQVGQDDGRLYQAEYVQYKSVKNTASLRNLAQADHRRLSSIEPEIDNVVAWDVPGFASLSSLRCGDEVEVVSENTLPPVSTWRRVVEISRNPVESVVSLGLEQA